MDDLYGGLYSDAHILSRVHPQISWNVLTWIQHLSQSGSSNTTPSPSLMAQRDLATYRVHSCRTHNWINTWFWHRVFVCGCSCNAKKMWIEKVSTTGRCKVTISYVIEMDPMDDLPQMEAASILPILLSCDKPLTLPSWCSWGGGVPCQKQVWLQWSWGGEKAMLCSRKSHPIYLGQC